MKKITLMLFALLFGMAVNAQTVLYEDDMESYPDQSFLAQQNTTWWTTWSNNPGSGEDAQILTTFAYSPTKSASVDETGGATDCIMKLGDKTSGSYELSWYMYVQTGKCGYYNIQHFQSPGTEWAFELYFRADGSTELQVGGDLITGTYPKDTWFECKHVIDLDNDNIELYINGVLLYEWPFSYEASGTGGTLQLGGVDFFAGAASGSGESPVYFFDNVSFKEMTAATNPVITVNPTNVATWALAGSSSAVPMTVGNVTGLSDLVYNTNIIYDVDALKTAPVTTAPTQNYVVKKTLTKASPAPTNGGNPNTDGSAVLHYDGDNYSAVGWSSVPITVTCAARFPNNMTVPYAGMNLTSVDLYINELNTGTNTFTLKIYEGGTEYEPGTLICSQDFTPVAQDWNTVTLTTPIPVTGADLWVGYTFTQVDDGIFIPGTDEGPNDPNGDFLSTGVGWSHLSSNPNLPYNWNIRANLEGDVISQWLSIAPTSGTIVPGDSVASVVTCDAADLAIGTYTATLRFISNDPVNPTIDVPVTFTVAGVGMGENSKLGVAVYPNPAIDVINVIANDKINGITITDFTGKLVYTGTSTSINVSNFSTGVYFIQTITEKGTVNSKFIKK